MRSICSRQILPKELTKFQEASNYFETFAVTIIQRCVELKSRSREKMNISEKKFAFVELLRALEQKLGLKWHTAALPTKVLFFLFLLSLSLTHSVLFLIMCLYQTIKLLFVKTSQFLFSSCRNNLICHIFFNLMS
jgi:hypothetical protein